MEKRVELSLLMDFYGPLLTEKRRDVMRLYCDEDMGLQEIADRLEISRQGVYDAVKTAAAALEHYEEVLGLADRYLRIGREIRACLRQSGAGQREGAFRRDERSGENQRNREVKRRHGL